MLEHKGDFVQSAFLLGTVYFAAVWLVYQTTTSLFNPAVGFSVGFDDLWNYTLMLETRTATYTADPLWNWFWIAWIIGPLIGSSLAVPFVDVYKKHLEVAK